MNPTHDFTGQVALVTGGTSGRALPPPARSPRPGGAVVIADINETTLGTTATDELTAAGLDTSTGCGNGTRAGTARLAGEGWDVALPTRAEEEGPGLRLRRETTEARGGLPEPPSTCPGRSLRSVCRPAVPAVGGIDWTERDQDIAVVDCTGRSWSNNGSTTTQRVRSMSFG